MKNLLLLFAMATIPLLYSCEKKLSKEDIVRMEVERRILEVMDDPSSYEFANIKLVDSLTNKQNIKMMKIHNDLEYSKRSIDRVKEMLSFYEDQASFYNKRGRSDDYTLKKIEEYKSDLKIHKEILISDSLFLRSLDSLETAISYKINDPIIYTYAFSFRGNNKLGVKVMNIMYVQSDAVSDTVITVTDEMEKLIEYSFDHIPKYKELRNQSL